MKEVVNRLIKFRDDRNWKQFHTPNNLAKSIVESNFVISCNLIVAFIIVVLINNTQIYKKLFN